MRLPPRHHHRMKVFPRLYGQITLSILCFTIDIKSLCLAQTARSLQGLEIGFVAISPRGIWSILQQLARVSQSNPNPGQILYFFGVNLHDILNDGVSLEEFLPESALMPVQAEHLSAQEKARLVLNYLNTRLDGMILNPFILNTISKIEMQKGRVRVNDLADQVGYSRRNRERTFKALIGILIKKFILNNRFQHALGLLREGTASSDIIYSCGYFDQAHFIDDFKELSGLTPGQFVKNDWAASTSLN